MRRTRFDQASCPIARTTDLFGDWWTPLVLRELLYGRSRFDQIQQRLDISRPILTQRLRRLEEEGMVTRRPYQEAPERHEYELTPKGEAAWGVLAAMWRFGSDWLFPGAGPPVELFDRSTGRAVVPAVFDESTRAEIDHTRVGVRARQT